MGIEDVVNVLVQWNRQSRRALPFLFTVLGGVVLLSGGLLAQAGGYGPPPLINLASAFEGFIIYFVCPVGAIALLAFAALKASAGQHGGGSGVAVSIVSAVALLTITVIRTWMRSL